jgi:hypothetical protein
VSNHAHARKLAVIRPIAHSRDHLILQRELEDLAVRKARIRRELHEVQQLEERIAMELCHGAKVEPGPRHAELVPERAEGKAPSSTFLLKLLILCAVLAFLPRLSSAQSLPTSTDGPRLRKFVFAGNTRLEAKIDEMTDRQICTVLTPLNGGVSVGISDRAASVFTPSETDVDRHSPALLRVDNDAPLELIVPARPNEILIPAQIAPDFVRALYARRRLRIRFVKWPEEAEVNTEIEPGDFASAYDHAAELCHWPDLHVQAAHPSAAPIVLHSQDGVYKISFGPGTGWSLEVSPSNITLDAAPGITLLSWFHRQLARGGFGFLSLRFFNRDGQEVATISPRPRGASVDEIARASVAAGSDGSIEILGDRYSLFGYQEAVAYVEKNFGLDAGGSVFAAAEKLEPAAPVQDGPKAKQKR